MTTSLFRQRGLEVEIDTMVSAEFDAKSFQIPESVMERVALNLKTEPFSERDRIVKSFTVRELFTYDVLFMLTREAEKAVVTIMHIQPHDPDLPLAVHLRRLERIATLRSAIGF